MRNTYETNQQTTSTERQIQIFTNEMNGTRLYIQFR